MGLNTALDIYAEHQKEVQVFTESATLTLAFVYSLSYITILFPPTWLLFMLTALVLISRPYLFLNLLSRFHITIIPTPT